MTPHASADARHTGQAGSPAALKGRGNTAVRLLAFLRRHPFPMLGVAFPTAIVAAYYLLLATPVFVSESKFVVRLSSPSSHSPVGDMLQSSGITRSQDDTFSVSDFLLSRDALHQLNEREPLRGMFSSPQVDFLARFPRPW